ncbi:unnamed protein product [Mucor hiemalis]
MPINKNGFQPKDARAVSIYHQDVDDEMDEIFGTNEKVQGKKIMTGTQALVEFLKTTSPEEFQRTSSTTTTTTTTSNTVERSSNIFSRMRKPKRNNIQSQPTPIPTPSISARSVPSSTASLPVTLGSTLTAPTSYHGSELNNIIHRKNYIEIVPQQKMISKSAGNSRSPSFETTSASIQSFVLRNNNNNNNNNNNSSNKNSGEPILPNKKRESSLYSGSLRHSASIRSQLSTTFNHRHSNVNSNRKLIDEVKATEDYIVKSDGMDMIESALLQRLERFKILSHEIPSVQVATGLATEHVRALGITHTLDNIINRENNKSPRKTRHMQVQTEPTSYNDNSTTKTTTSTTTAAANTSTEEENQDFEKRAKRAEAALENALDHFEVISGLAYKKLREIWEEKMRWENACMELRDRLVVLEQKKYPLQHQLQQQQQQQQQQPQQGYHPNNNYFLEEHEEEDELGLSEFPCSE